MGSQKRALGNVIASSMPYLGSVSTAIFHLKSLIKGRLAGPRCAPSDSSGVVSLCYSRVPYGRRSDATIPKVFASDIASPRRWKATL